MTNFSRRLGVFTSGSLLLGLCLAQACSAEDSGPSSIDKDGDGVADDLGAVTVDANGDGEPDLVDLNMDGTFAVGLDTDGDGVIDAEGLDTNNDKIIDCIDREGDGDCETSSMLDGGADGNPDGGMDSFNLDGGSTGGSGGEEPETCADAAKGRTYVGCEFWPTITFNKVYEQFNFAVVIANGQASDASITVEGGGLSAPITDTVPAGGLKAISLPWVAALKGPIWANANTSGGRTYNSVRADKGAFKVTSSIPVTAWQFNPLQYKKPASEIPGCGTSFMQADCFSVSNDASLLVPSTALTKSYRVFTWPGDNSGDWGSAPGGIAITATQDGTTVDVQYGPECDSAAADGASAMCTAGGDVPEKAASGIDTFTMNAGDVIQLVGDFGAYSGVKHADLSGSVVQSDKPVMVVGFNPLTNVPDSTTGNADHMEETVLPAEVIGKSYVLPAPTTPSGAVKGGHLIRVFGNVDGTKLTWTGTAPAGAPTTINAGEVWQSGEVTAGCAVSGDKSFAVSSVMLGGQKQGDGACPEYPCSGDPAMSMAVTPEQFRTQYTFLAPIDYDKNFADVLVPDGAADVKIDGMAVTAAEEVAPGWKIARVALSNTGTGAHSLTADVPVGLQVMGFGHATSYYYPGGLNLKLISEPPVIVK